MCRVGGMALADNCVHGGFCCNIVEHADITTGELCEIYITGSVIVHCLHSVHKGNAISRVHVCPSAQPCICPFVSYCVQYTVQFYF